METDAVWGASYLLVELVDDALRPLQVQVFALQGAVDVCQLNAHLADQQPVIFIRPINAVCWVISHLERRKTVFYMKSE